MKKIINKIIFILCLGLITSGCSGVSDYKILLNNDYYIAKTSANNAKIYKVEDKDNSGNAPSIPIYHEDNSEEFEKESVIEVGQNERYIIASTNLNKYYILDTKKEIVMEFQSENEFNSKKKSLGISDITLKKIDEYKK